jgi:hypothetical protein
MAIGRSNWNRGAIIEIESVLRERPEEQKDDIKRKGKDG